ncbi:MAG: VCBS repeat-containing protein [Rhodospirillales bacterium]|nr:VCBS repeat-containing protein [Rhodospirillales bacterium]
MTPENVVRVFSRNGKAVILDSKGREFLLSMKGGKLTLVPQTESHREETLKPGMLPDGIISKGRRNIAQAWLTGPTRRYGHGILGDAIEASGVVAELSKGKRLQLTLDENAVFEDRLARLADLDGDGMDEIIAVKTYLNEGSALAVIKPGATGLKIVAETPPIGLTHRWLNPAGIADFTGDGRLEVAVVKTPHIGGTLEIYGFQNGAITLKGASQGYSNHTMGDRELGKAAVVDANADGTPDIALPDASQRRLRLVTFKGGEFRELAWIGHEGAAFSTAIIAADINGDGRKEIVYGLRDRRLIAVFIGL